MSTAIKINKITHAFFGKTVVEKIQTGIKDTLSQLGDFNVTFQTDFVQANWKSPTNISVLLRFKQSEHPLEVKIHFDTPIATQILETLTGESVDPQSPEILDGIGEISNMIYGLIKTKVKDLGFSFGMSRPEAYFTNQIEILKSSEIQSLIIPFKVNEGQCYFEFVVL
jgi:CheY-specific phosphatase CheX